MWPSSGNNNAPYQDFNQDGLQSSPFSPSFPFPGHQGLPLQHLHMNALNNEGILGIEFQSQNGFHNQESFAQNGAMSPQIPYSPIQHNVNRQRNSPNPSRSATQINARAAELKAQLLKDREARRSPIPPVFRPNSKQAALADVSVSRPLKTPISTSKNHEQEVNDLISQYSDNKKVGIVSADLNTEKVDDASSTTQKDSEYNKQPAKPGDLSLGTPTNSLKSSTNSSNAAQRTVEMIQKRHDSNGSISEGEIVEDQDTPKKTLPAPAPGPETRERRTSHKPLTRGEDPPQVSSQRLPEVSHDDGLRQRENIQPLQEERSSEQKVELIPASKYYKRRNSHDDGHKSKPSNIHNQQTPSSPQQMPNFMNTLARDSDLREWLEITGYHNVPYRDQVLGRRRALARVRAEEKRILAEIEAERALPVSPMPQGSVTMLPPPPNNRAGLEPNALRTLMEVDTDVLKRDRPSNKRIFSDLDDGCEEGSSGKIARTNDQVHGPRTRNERSKDNDESSRRPRSSGFGIDRRSSIEYHDERGSDRRRHENGRSWRGDRDGSRERDWDGRRAYEGRSSVREVGSYHRDDYDERAPAQVSGYKGRAYDPNYKTRGWARGRGDFQGSSQRSDKSPKEHAFGAKLASSKPYRDPKGFNKGSKGDTRYFIVKSFNEENVLNCIEDSVWTTQSQNGPIFKEAFENCKNVILVFSINKSRAFQGYARMESLPGSIEIPKWQETITWASAGAFKVKWLVICSTRFHRVGHLKNALNENQAVLIGKDGQEIEENCGAGLVELIDEEARETLKAWKSEDEDDYLGRL